MSQLVVSCGAASLYASSHLAITGTIDLRIATAVAAATWIMYAAHRWIGLRLHPDLREVPRFKYVASRPVLFLSGALICGLYLLITTPYMIRSLGWTYLLGPAIISSLYSLPIIGPKRLRDLPYIKIFVLAATWSWITVLWALPEQGILHSWSLAGACFLFIIAITIPFDIRDQQTDHESQLATLVTLLGADKAKRLSAGLLLIAGALIIFAYTRDVISLAYLLALIITYLMSWRLIQGANASRPESYYSGFIDGVMIMPLILLALLSQILPA